MGGIQRVGNRSQIDSGKVWTSLGGAVIGGMLGGLTGSPIGLVKGVVKGGMQGADIYDTFAGKKEVDPLAHLGPTARARANLMRR
jgi:outer membrane lipoprotein SlyB